MENKFYTAKNDRVFRSIFVNDNDHHLLEALLSVCLKKDVKIVRILKTELSVKDVKEKVKRLDLVMEAKGEKINLELNTNFQKPIKVRNLNYFSGFYSENTKIGETYDYKTMFIHIDLSYGLGKNNPEEKTYTLNCPEYGDLYVENFKIVVFNMDRIMKFWYDKDQEGIEKYKLLIMLDLLPNELTKLYKISQNELVKEYKGKVCKLNEDLDFIAPVSAEEDFIALMNTEKEYAVEQGFEQGIEQGIEQGTKQGVEQSKIEIAKKLLEKNIDINIISETTGLSIEDIHNIKDNKITSDNKE